MIHPDLSNIGLLHSLRDEALACSNEATSTESKLAYKMLANACGYLANVIEKEDLSLRLEKSNEDIERLNELVRQLRIELTKLLDDTDK